MLCGISEFNMSDDLRDWVIVVGSCLGIIILVGVVAGPAMERA